MSDDLIEGFAPTFAKTYTLDEVVQAFKRWIHLPDETPLLAALGAVAANHLEGDAVWLLIVGPPGSGKTEIVMAFTALDDVHPAATLTEAALLSGTPRKERDATSKGGLLRTIGEFGIILGKDFGSVLNMNRDARAAMLAALREVYDGSWTRHVGTDGGRTLHWSGKVGMLAGCTPTIDRHHAVMSAMGERFTIVRFGNVDDETQAQTVLQQLGREDAMRRELSDAVAGLFAGDRPAPRGLSDEETGRLIKLSTLVARARSAVERDGYSREIELVPGHEAPTRITKQLAMILAGLDTIGCDRARSMRVLRRVALDTIPAGRLSVLALLEGCSVPVETSWVSEQIDLPVQTTRRLLEDLTAHGLVRRYSQGQGKSHMWRLTEFSRDRLSTFPEMSGHKGGGSDRERTGTPPDISGTPPESSSASRFETVSLDADSSLDEDEEWAERAAEALAKATDDESQRKDDTLRLSPEDVQAIGDELEDRRA